MKPAEVRENVAEALKDASDDWVLPYVFRALGDEDRSQRCRLALAREIAAQEQSIDSWFERLLDPVRPRLEDHYAKKDFWTRAVFFVAGPGQLNKADVQYLEAQLASRARAAKRIPLDNANKPNEPTISERDRAAMDVFSITSLACCQCLASMLSSKVRLSQRRARPPLACQGRGVMASGHDTPQGFVVQAGSFSAKDEVPSLRDHFPTVVELRADLLKSGVLVSEGEKLRFTQDYTFNSPSLASGVVLGALQTNAPIGKMRVARH